MSMPQTASQAELVRILALFFRNGSAARSAHEPFSVRLKISRVNAQP
jgi:hypothetical protein